MLRKWTLAGFKSVRDEISLDLAPLTLFTGANSSGKSSIFQSILLVSQTLQSRLTERTLILNGHLTGLGTLQAVRPHGETAVNLKLGWELEASQVFAPAAAERLRDSPRLFTRPFEIDTGARRLIRCDLEVGASTEVGNGPLEPVLKRIALKSEMQDPQSSQLRLLPEDGGAGLDLRATAIEGSIRDRAEALGLDGDDSDVNGLAFEVDVLDDESRASISEHWAQGVPVGMDFRHMLPDSLIIKFDREQEQRRQIVRALLYSRIGSRARYAPLLRDTRVPMDVMEIVREATAGYAPPGALDGDEASGVTIQQVLRVFNNLPPEARAETQRRLLEVEESGEEEMVGNAALVRDAPPALTEAVVGVDDFFSHRLRYLGPLRDEPQPVYARGLPAENRSLGVRGEYTAAVLDLHGAQAITYPRAGSPLIESGTITASLVIAVQEWLSYLGVAESIETRDLGDLGHGISVSTGVDGVQDALTHVGVGVSQVLPIVTLCLLANAGDTILLEQPELHLNPKVQVRLADLFIAMALQGKQCLIETHSEHILNRVRMRVADAPGNHLEDVARVVLVERTAGVTGCRQLPINRFGAIAEWPKDFFDESQRSAEAILQAASRKFRAERKE